MLFFLAVALRTASSEFHRDDRPTDFVAEGRRRRQTAKTERREEEDNSEQLYLSLATLKASNKRGNSRRKKSLIFSVI